MSGNIKLKARTGLTLKQKRGHHKEGDASYYPEAYLEVTGECGEKVCLSPSYNDLCNLLIAFRKHELKVDYNMNRKNYVSKLITQIEDLLRKLKQIKLNEYEKNEEIYTSQYKFKTFKEAQKHFK